MKFGIKETLACILTALAPTSQAEISYEIKELDPSQVTVIGPIAPSTAEEKKKHLDDFVELFSLAYGDITQKSSSRLLNFRTECVSTDYAKAGLRLIKNYNEFVGERVAKAFEKFRGKIECYELGRSGSPLLIVKFPYWTHQAENWKSSEEGTKIPDREITKLAREFKKIMVNELFADEFGQDEINEREYYVWWD